SSARIAILGTGGIGKTSLALSAVHHPSVVAKYSHIHFIACQSTQTSSDIASTIASHIGLPQSPNLSRKIIHHFTSSSPSLVVLDNFETPWEPSVSRPEVEDLLSSLTGIPHLAVMVIHYLNMFDSPERPTNVKWSRPFLLPLAPLDFSAARQTFIDIADDVHEEDSVRELLKLTGNLPLAVSLIAGVAAAEGCEATLFRWGKESTHLLSDGYDQRSSLDISIMLSFSCDRMTPDAQQLLSILSMLPDGLSDAELTQSGLPIDNILLCKATLLRTALAYLDGHQRLRVLAPIREHVLATHPPSNVLKLALRQYFHNMLEL
ncbi:hypothetical protein C8R44DRAFT_591843, partial [Mycena epipterygia]